MHHSRDRREWGNQDLDMDSNREVGRFEDIHLCKIAKEKSNQWYQISGVEG
jgi:hypothetical protein